MQNTSVAWNCPNCGTFNPKGKFCRKCRSERPAEVTEVEEVAQPVATPGWTCTDCGTYNPKGKFCRKCRSKRPEESTDAVPPDQTGWICTQCGTYNAKGKFCRSCRHQNGTPVVNMATPDISNIVNNVADNVCQGIDKLAGKAAAGMPVATQEAKHAFNSVANMSRNLFDKARSKVADLAASNGGSVRKQYCLECGAEIPVGASFCPVCGANQNN